MKQAEPDPMFFETPEDFHMWLKKHHKDETFLWVGYYKKDTGKKSITWPESVIEALRFGWIDGLRKSMGEESYKIRFTPRKPGSIWSSVNIRYVEELKKQKKMFEAGLKAYENRKDHRSEVYSFEQKEIKLEPAQQKIFKANKQAWANFEKFPPSYKKAALWWVISAKQEATRIKRLQTLIEDSFNGEKIKHLRR